MRKKSGPTIVEQATETIEGFAAAWKLLDQQVRVTLCGQSHSTIDNYIRRIAQISLHFMVRESGR
jgi:integrase/recombinase XerD